MSQMPNFSQQSISQIMRNNPGVTVFSVAVLLVLTLAYRASGSSSNSAPMTEEAISARIQKVGSLSLMQGTRAPKSGEEVFKAQCTTCHTAGVVGAPKFADAAAWAPRIKTGYDALLVSALKGKGNMGAQGGGVFSDDDVARAVVYMANAAGAKFDEPKMAAAPAAPVSAAK